MTSETNKAGAMPRYFFSLVDGQHSAVDTYGKELDSLYEAHVHALRMFEKLLQFIPDQLSPTCQIRITSAAGEPVLTVFLPALACEERFRKVVGASRKKGGNGPSTIPAHNHRHATHPYRSRDLRHTA